MLTMVVSPPFDGVGAEALTARIVAGTDVAAAWKAFVALVTPEVQRIVRSSRKMGPLKHSVDHCMNAVTRVLEKLAHNQHQALRTYAAWRAASPGKSYGDWLRIVSTNVVRDYVTSQLGGGAPTEGDASSAKKRLMHTLATILPPDDQLPRGRPGVTDAQTARQILEFAKVSLDERQRAALACWLGGADVAEIGAQLGISNDDAYKALRAGLAKLRREFANA